MTDRHDTIAIDGDTDLDGAAHMAAGTSVTAASLRTPTAVPLREEMEPNMVAVLDLTDVAERPIIERRVGERRLGERRVGEREVSAADFFRGMPPRRERRNAHLFQGADGSDSAHIVARSCLICGYGEAGHLSLTGPEQEVVTGLLNQRQPPALMRRSILRKLTSRLHRIR
jgi:hypothetical protein